jgi:hypothetical protein
MHWQQIVWDFQAFLELVAFSLVVLHQKAGLKEGID